MSKRPHNESAGQTKNLFPKRARRDQGFRLLQSENGQKQSLENREIQNNAGTASEPAPEELLSDFLPTVLVAAPSVNWNRIALALGNRTTPVQVSELNPGIKRDLHLLVNAVLAASREANQNASSRVPSQSNQALDPQRNQRLTEDDGQTSALRNRLPAHIKVASPIATTKWTVEDIPKSLPSLPTILDPAMEAAVFTHLATNPNVNMNYERFEWIGDAYLEMLASAFIYQTFPDLSVGRISQLRELIICNATLAKYSTAYGFLDRARLPDEYRGGLLGKGPEASAKEKVKVTADLFEAYVGAVILSDPNDGLEKVSNWTKALWATKLEKEIRNQATMAAQGHEKKCSKDRLSDAIVVKGIRITYKDLATKRDSSTNLTLYVVSCCLTGWGETEKQLGYGTAVGKREAGQKAAQMALEDEKLIKYYSEKKRAYLAARETSGGM